MQNESQTYEFDEQLRMSEGVANTVNVSDILLSQIPGAKIVSKANKTDDRNGTDWWVEMASGQRLSIDAKIRRQDFGKNDLALEIWSVMESNRIGWTRDPSKRTDYVLWFWRDTQRFCLLPFTMLCKVFQEHWQEWAREYKCAKQHTPNRNGGYHSECVYVPIRTVWAAIYKRYSGAAYRRCSRS